MSIAANWAQATLSQLSGKGLRRNLEPIESAQGATVRVGGERLVNFSSNDYLGLAADPRLAAAATQAMGEWGVGSGASRLVCGDTLAHRQLEQILKEFEHAGEVVLFNGGYSANVGIISALVGQGDDVFSDELNHASIIDGCRLSRARTVVYRHKDLADLSAKLEESRAQRKLICTDSVFSMDGDTAPLVELVSLCRDAKAALLVDEAHATGVLGSTGAGLCEALGVEGQVDVRMGTLGKALGVYGAYAATDPEVASLFINCSRSLVFSTSLPPMVCAAARRAVEIVLAEPERREKLWSNVHRFSEGLSSLGVAAKTQSAIVPLVVGSPERAVEASIRMREAGLLVKAIRPPTVPEGTSRLRFALSSAHTPGQIDRALEAISQLKGTGSL